MPMHLSEGATQLQLHAKLQCYVKDIASQWCFSYDILYKTWRFFRFCIEVEEVRQNSGKAGVIRILPWLKVPQRDRYVGFQNYIIG